MVTADDTFLCVGKRSACRGQSVAVPAYRANPLTATVLWASPSQEDRRNLETRKNKNGGHMPAVFDLAATTRA
jgi:hypothetical protein